MFASIFNKVKKSNQSQEQQFKSVDQNQQKILEKSYNVFQNVQLQCSNDQEAGFYCSEQYCNKNAVICNNKKCKCQQIHQQCSDFIKVNSFHNKINKNVIQVQENLINKIQLQIDSVIDKISNLLINIKQKIKRFGLTKGQNNLISYIREHFNIQQQCKSLKIQQTDDYITGQSLYNFKKQFPKQKNIWFQTSLKQYQYLVNQTYKNIQPYFKSLCYTLETIHAKLNPQQQLKSYFYSSKIVDYHQKNQNTIPDIMKLSDIMQKNIPFHNFQSIQRIFQYDKNIPNNFNSLFRNCQNQSNLLFLIKNNYNKKIGFFLSSQINKDNIQSKPDQKMNSFIFSITQGKQLNIRSSSINYRILKQKQKIRIQIGDAYLNPSQTKSKAGFLLEIQNIYGKAQTFSAQLLFPGQQFYSQHFNFNHNKLVTYDKVNGTYKNQNISGLQVVSLQIYKLQMKQSYYEFIKQLNNKLKKQVKLQSTASTTNSLLGQPNNQKPGQFRTGATGGNIFGNNSLSFK